MKRILTLVAISLLLCSTASAQGGGGESTKKGSSEKKAVTKKKTSGIKSANTTPPKPPASPVPTRTPAPTVQVFGPGLSIDLGSNVKLELVLIRAGSFQMGSYEDDIEKPVHGVTISQPFYMGKYEVTQGQWQSVMGNNPSYFKNNGTSTVFYGDGTSVTRNTYFKNCDRCPVEQVSWDDAQQFLAKLNARNDGIHYRLPSEAEWEYACRAGTTGDYAGDLDKMAWYGNNSGRARLDAAEIWRTDITNYEKRIAENGGQTHAVGTKQPNAFGLFDMHGNVFEWCEDWSHPNYEGAPSDGSAWLSGEQKSRVARGGSWFLIAPSLRSASRGAGTPEYRNALIGFRVVAVR